MSEARAEAWPELAGLIQSSPVHNQVRPPRSDSRTADKLSLTNRSYLGALALNTSGVLVDSGWLRLLGGSSGDQLPGLDEANADARGLLVVGFDVLGGVFALDGGALGTGDGAVHHFSVDTLRWENLELNHSAFVSAMLRGATTDFYDSLRWPGWEAEVRSLRPQEGISAYPFPFTAEGKDVAAASRRAVPFVELIRLHNDMVRQIDGQPASLVPLPVWST
ncbi:DUF2625 family protein [Curtobacterium sp. L1-20]|uniref:DUF2625 family protein n=1 Tax=Curtobacterium sp. L1-20 TaxID=3138181 RepID=UPI003B52CB39